jgi:hypothetical protein
MERSANPQARLALFTIAVSGHPVRYLPLIPNPSSQASVRRSGHTKEKSMAKARSSAQRNDVLPQSSNVPNEMISQVGKAVVEIMKLRQTFEENMATAHTEEEAQGLAEEVETAAVRVIGDQGLTVDQYNHVLNAAQDDEDLEERVLLACRAA